jgi:hypothetical protein
MEHQPKVHSATDVAENPFHRSPVRVTRGMHMETHLLDDILQLWASMSEVLKSTNNRPIEGRVRGRSTITSGELGLRVDGCTHKMTVKHANDTSPTISIIFDAPCLFLYYLLSVSLHFVVFLYIFWN